MAKKRILNIAKEGFWIIFSQLFSIVGSFYYIKLTTNKLEPSLYGTVSLFLSVSVFFGQVIYGGVGSAVSRFFTIAESQREFRRYFESIKKIVSRLSVFLMLFGGIIVVIFSIFGSRNLLILTIFILFISILNGLISVISNIQNAARERLIVALNNGLGVVLKIGLAILLFNLFGENEMSLIFSLLLASSITLFSQFFFLRTKFNSELQIAYSFNHDYNWYEHIWKYSSSVILWSGFMALYQLSDKWALGYYNSSKEVGAYTVFFQLGYSPSLLVMSNLLALLSPIIYKRAGDGKDKVKNKYVDLIITKLIWLTLLFSVAGSLITYFYHSEISSNLVGESYLEYSYLLPGFVLSAGVFAAGQILNLKLESQLKVKEMNFVKISTSLFGISINFSLSALYGINGLLIALFIYSISYYLGMLIISKT